MKNRGSALIVVLCITSVLGVLFVRIYRRASLILLTAVDREKCIKMTYATDALMLYAVYMAKHNWSFLLEMTKAEGSEHHFMWDIGLNKVPATCVYTFIDKDTLGVEVLLTCSDTAYYKRSCRLRYTKGQVEINSWREK